MPLMWKYSFGKKKKKKKMCLWSFVYILLIPIFVHLLNITMSLFVSLRYDPWYFVYKQ